MLKIILILLAIVVLISVLLVLILFQLGKRPDPNKSHNEYYDENGNHIYYDRKLIEHQKREQEHAAQNKK